jgi:septum formation inhibitor MinC
VDAGRSAPADAATRALNGSRTTASSRGNVLALLRGTAAGLEFVFGEGSFSDAWSDMRERLGERPDFYRGSRATVVFEGDPPEAASFLAFAAAIWEHGIELRGLYGSEAFVDFAARQSLEYLGPAPRPRVASFERKRAAKAGSLTDAALSLDADFAGARADIARRRARGEPSVPKPVFGPGAGPATASPVAAALPSGPHTMYHRGTLRGGQSLQQLGNIVVIGDVNPGAELVASGDVVVFGALRGTAHAGAQGDSGARVFALELAPTQLRIGTLIAAEGQPVRDKEPEVAFVDGDRIAIAPYAKLGANR